MGLAEPKRKFKLSNDPNNTKWSKNTTSFGHKIMIEQGWTPGQFLGAQDAPHAEFHTEANASHIRVVLKDDNLGIGAKKGSGVNQGECVGLDVFQTLLGRLNSTDEEEYVKEQSRREDLQRAIYTEQKWGTIRFVHGGFLIGDKIQDLIDGEKERVKNLKEAESDSDSSSDSDSDSDEDEDEEEKPKKAIEVETAKLTLDTKSKKRKSEDDGEDTAAKKARKGAEKVDRKAQKAAEKEDDSKLSKKERKQKRKERKAAKKERRAEKAAKKEAKASAKKDGKKDKKRSRDESSSSAVPTPPVSGTSTPRPILQSGRLAVRARNIEAKRMAAMHGASINEIFMIKGQ